MSANNEETCATCAHRQHESGQCKAHYRVTFKKGEPGDPCHCMHQASWDRQDAHSTARHQ